MLQLSSPLIRCSEKIARHLNFERTDRPEFFYQLSRALEPLLENTTWLPQALITPRTESYRREVLFDDPLNRFSVACLVWGPHQATPIHDHKAWGVIGVVQGMLRSETFERFPGGRLEKRAGDEMLIPGACTIVDPRDPHQADVHRLGNADLSTTISIHIYGCALNQINRERYGDEAWR